MNKSITFLLACFGTLAATAADPRLELDGVTCTHWKNPNNDATLAVSLQYKEEGSDFAEVEVKERFTSRYLHDPLWVTIHKASEQVASGEKRFSLGVDGFSMVIDRPIPKSSRRRNAEIDFGNGTAIKLTCEKNE